MKTSDTVGYENHLDTVNILSIESTYGENAVNMMVNGTLNDDAVMQLQIITEHELDHYEELSKSEVHKMRDFLNNTFPLTPRELISATVKSLKYLVLKNY